MQVDVLAALGDDAKFFVENANGRLHCTLTNIDVLADADSVTAHLHSKRFKAAKVEAGLKQFGPYVVTSPEYPDKLQCTLTGVLINKNEDAVWKHMMGKKFQRLLGEKEAEKAAAKNCKSDPPGPSKEGPAKPSEPSPIVPEAEAEASSSSEEEDDDEEGGFWIPPPGSRRDEDREAEVAAGGEDVVMEEPDDVAGANGHASSSKGANSGGKRKSKHPKGTASSNGDKRTTKSMGPAENAPQKKKRRPQG